MAEIDRNDMVVLERQDCLRRLGRTGVGRVAVSVDGDPAIFPVNYAVWDDDIYFLTTSGSKLSAATEGAVLAFEVDHVDAFEHTGWSVVVIGRSCVVPAQDTEPLWKLKLGRWAGGGPAVQVRIRSERVSGREIGRPGGRRDRQPEPRAATAAPSIVAFPPGRALGVRPAERPGQPRAQDAPEARSVPSQPGTSLSGQ